MPIIEKRKMSSQLLTAMCLTAGILLVLAIVLAESWNSDSGQPAEEAAPPAPESVQPPALVAPPTVAQLEAAARTSPAEKEKIIPFDDEQYRANLDQTRRAQAEALRQQAASQPTSKTERSALALTEEQIREIEKSNRVIF